MAFNAYLTVTGQKQGEIHGAVNLAGLENTILVHSFSHQIVSPRDPASGLATGKRQHQALLILKEIDKSSPRLRNAFVSNETLVDWALQFRGTADGAAAGEKQDFIIRLTNASISSMRNSMNDNEDPNIGSLPLREEITFTYQKIEWIWSDGGITAEDSWETPGG